MECAEVTLAWIEGGGRKYLFLGALMTGKPASLAGRVCALRPGGDRPG